MAQDTEHIPLDEFLRHTAESLEKARQTTEGVILEDQGNTYRIVYEGEAGVASPGLSAQDPFLALAGAFESSGPSDVSSHKHDYLADAYGDRHTS